jgi:hypothetical protein
MVYSSMWRCLGRASSVERLANDGFTTCLLPFGSRSKPLDFRDARHSGDGVEIGNGLLVDSGEITQFNKIHAPFA